MPQNCVRKYRLFSNQNPSIQHLQEAWGAAIIVLWEGFDLLTFRSMLNVFFNSQANVAWFGLSLHTTGYQWQNLQVKTLTSMFFFFQEWFEAREVDNRLGAQVLLLNGGMCGLWWGWALRGNSLENTPHWVILTETTPWGSMAAQALSQQHTGKSGRPVQGGRVMSKQKSCRCWSPVKKDTRQLACHTMT